MKNTFFIIASIFIATNLGAQEVRPSDQSKIFQKLVLDLGAVPFGILNTDDAHMASYNFSLGYQITQRLDIRLTADVFNIYEYEYRISHLKFLI